ncbi:MAG TPA: 30S ribosomal protein S6 [Candidatus Paceibacterota bacterium]
MNGNSQNLDQSEELKKDYEISFLLDAAEAVSAVAQIFGKFGVEIPKSLTANQIRLAYLINKRESAFFGFFSFKAAPEMAARIKSELALQSSIVRFLIVRLSSREAARHGNKGFARTHTPDSKPSAPAEPPVLSNEALEQKLEEILK